ncbi:MAG: hypothetical protein WCS69_14460 [Ignavibacteriaceae bacterium]|jgi:hypothetical protein
MKKLLFLILLIITFYGCEKKFDSPLESDQAVYQIAQVSVFDSFTRTLTDSIINPSIKFTSTSDIRKVWIEIISPDNETLSPGQISLYDNGSPNTGDAVKGDKIYSNLVVMKREYINGMYSINYFVEDKAGTTKKVASQSFHFDRGEINISPIIVSVSLPDTIEVKNVPLSFIITATVADSNGINDINEVYFITYKPDQSSNGAKTSLYDDGNSSADGDVTAGDGIFSRAIIISPENQKGKYRFDFQAKDRGGLVSQVVQKYIVVK